MKLNNKPMTPKIFLTAALAALFSAGGFAQETEVVTVTETVTEEIQPAEPKPDSVYTWMGQAAVTWSSSHTPLWLTSNRYGLSSVSSNNGYVRAGFFKKMTHEKRFSWGAGVDLVAPWNFSSNFIIQQLYAQIRYRSLELTVGSKERTLDIVDNELSSGDLTFSANARPIPQVFISMPNYEFVPGTKRWLAAKGFFGIGMFTDWRWQEHHVVKNGKWQEHVLYASKGLMLRVGDPERHPLTFEGGLEMGTTMGGTVHYYNTTDKKMDVIKMPHDFKNICKAIIGLSGGDSDDPKQWGERANAYGNTVGQWSAALTLKPAAWNGWSIRQYFEHYFEDHSMMFFDYMWKDMLLGTVIEFPKNPFVDKFLYEYLGMKDQAGPIFNDTNDKFPEQVSGSDGYYNHNIYPGGWGHWGMGMGNPLPVSPIYNKNRSLTFKHNRVKAHHFGISGTPCDLFHYRVLMTYNRSWGTYDEPTNHVMHDFSWLIDATFSPQKWDGWKIGLSIAGDTGSLMGKSTSAMLTLTKTGWIH